MHRTSWLVVGFGIRTIPWIGVPKRRDSSERELLPEQRDIVGSAVGCESPDPSAAGVLYAGDEITSNASPRAEPVLCCSRPPHDGVGGSGRRSGGR